MQWSVLRLGFKIDLEDIPLFVFVGTSSGTASNQQARNKGLSGSGGGFSCFSISHCACHCSPHPSPDIRLWLPCPSMWAEYPQLLGRLQNFRSGRGGTQLPGLSRPWVVSASQCTDGPCCMFQPYCVTPSKRSPW